MFINYLKTTSTLTRTHLQILVLFIVYCTIFTSISIQKYRAFNHDFDTGNILQAFHNTLDGHFMETTSLSGENNTCRFQGHTEIIYLLFLPMFALFPSAVTLLLLQAIAIALGGIAVYLIARRVCHDTVSPVVLAICYWCYPLLASINLIDIHADAFIIAPQLFAWYFLTTGRKRMFWGTIIIGMLVKEHAFIFNGLLGLLLFRRQRKTAVMLLLLSVGQFTLITPLIQRLAGVSRYQLSLEGHVVTNRQLTGAQTVIVWIKQFFGNVTSPRSVFILVIAITLNITLLLFPPGLLLVLPLCMIFIASGSVQTHRHAILITPLFITLVEGVGRIRPDRQFRYVLTAVLPPILLTFLIAPDSLIATNLHEMVRPDYRNVFHYRYTPHDAITDSLITLVPPKVPVATDAPLRTKLANRQWAFIHPAPADSMRADYYMFDFFEKREYDDAWPVRTRAAALLQSGKFTLESFYDGLLLLKRAEDCPTFKIPGIQPYADIAKPRRQEYTIEKISLVPEENGCIMHTWFFKHPSDTLHHAFISFFIDTGNGDMLKVLHLASYTACRLEQLSPGTYREQFYFDIPEGCTLNGRMHEIWLYKKPGYLPFFARKEYRSNLIWSEVVPPLLSSKEGT